MKRGELTDLCPVNRAVQNLDNLRGEGLGSKTDKTKLRPRQQI